MIGVALVGAGYWGPNIANSLKSTGLATLKAI
jgi:glycerol-3-phosphate dehydrogenase